jgi:hypothetical protein
MAYVAIKVVHRNSMNAVDTRGLFVKPADLVMPDSIDASGAAKAVRTHVVV